MDQARDGGWQELETRRREAVEGESEDGRGVRKMEWFQITTEQTDEARRGKAR